MFVDLTASYDIVCHRGLTCKLLKILPVKHMTEIIMELVQSRSFTFIPVMTKKASLRRLKNGVPRGSVLALLFYNFYAYVLSSLVSKKYAYADDLALLHISNNWKSLEGSQVKTSPHF